jgi:hypothetical protein
VTFDPARCLVAVAQRQYARIVCKSSSAQGGAARGLRKISKQFHVNAGHKPLYVRAFDAAGNRSHWHKVRKAAS